MSMHNTVIESVTQRVVNRKRDGKEITIYTITDAQGTKWTTAMKSLATEANRLVGQDCIVQGTVEQNGEYTNYLLDAIHAPGTAIEHESDTFQRPYNPHVAPPTASTMSPPSAPIKNTDDNIWRQCATKVSARISDNPAAFWANCDDLVRYYETGQKPQLTSNGSIPQENKFIPEAALAGAGSDARFTGDDDIPF